MEAVSPALIGSTGVALLLIAFALNLTGRLSERSRLYLWMNIAGSALAAAYAWMDGAVPFLVLELVWATAAAVRLVLLTAKKNPRRSAAGG